MPQALPAVAAWAATAWSSAVTATAVGLTKAGVMAAIGEGATIALAGKIVSTGAMIALSAGAAALMRPNTPSSGTTLDFKPDPKAPVRGAMGYTALGGNKVFQATWGYKKVAMSLGVALSLGPIDQITQFRADDSVVTFAGAQQEATGFYAADMWQRTTTGLPSDAALLPPTGLKYGNPGLTGWGSQHAAPGVSFAFWTMVLAKNPEDRDIFTNGVPDPRWVGRWMKVWDPRKDSTYPGGSGSQRRDDWRTWAWSENPYVHALAWARGHYKMNLNGSIDRSRRIAGIGAPDAAIDMVAFVEGMNVADANAWTISGEWSTSDSKFQTLVAMLQAGGGEPISRGAQISVMVNAPRVSTYTYTRDDLIGQAEVRPLTPRRDRKNTIVPRYRSEAHGWEYVPAGEVTAQVYRDEDRGEPRSLEIEYVHVRNAKQAGQLAAYDLANLREGLTATLPSKAHLMHVHPGDCITVDVPEVALAGQKFIVRRTTVNHQSASVTLELRAETDGKHAWALGQAAQPAPSPSLSAVDPKYIDPPMSDDWVIEPRPPAPDGSSQPVIVITGLVETADIAQVIIEHGRSNAGPWTVGYSGPPMTNGRYEISGMEPDTEYWVSVRYLTKNGTVSDRTLMGPVKAGSLISGNVTHIGDRLVGDFANLPERVELLDVEVDTINAEVEQQRTDLAGVAAGLINNGVAITQEAQRRETDDETTATTLGLIGARSPDGLTFIIDRDKVMVGPGISFAQRDSLIEAQFAGTASSHIFDVASTAAEEASASAEALRQIGVDLANASAWQLDSAKIKVTPTETLNQRLISIGAALTNRPTGEQVDARVTSAMNAGVGADGVIAEYVNAVFTKKGQFETRAGMLLEAIDGVSARASLFVDANGRVGGLNVGAEQERIDLELAFDRVFFVDVSSGAKVQVLNYIGGQWTFNSNVRITGDLLVEGTIRNEKIQQNTITGLSASYQAGQINLNGTAPVVVAEVWTAVEKTGSPVVIDFNAWLQLRHDASGSFTSTIEIRRSADTGVGVQILTHSVEGSGMANDTFAGMVPFKVIDRPGPGFWRYFVRISSNTDTMSVQNSKTRYISATEYKTNQ